MFRNCSLEIFLTHLLNAGRLRVNRLLCLYFYCVQFEHYLNHAITTNNVSQVIKKMGYWSGSFQFILYPKDNSTYLTRMCNPHVYVNINNYLKLYKIFYLLLN